MLRKFSMRRWRINWRRILSICKRSWGIFSWRGLRILLGLKLSGLILSKWNRSIWRITPLRHFRFSKPKYSNLTITLNPTTSSVPVAPSLISKMMPPSNNPVSLNSTQNLKKSKIRHHRPLPPYKMTPNYSKKCKLTTKIKSTSSPNNAMKPRKKTSSPETNSFKSSSYSFLLFQEI
jgi:hypothetical protein